MDPNIDYAMQLRKVPSNTPVFGPYGLTTVGAILPPGVPRVDPLAPQSPLTTKAITTYLPWFLGAGVLAYLIFVRRR